MAWAPCSRLPGPTTLMPSVALGPSALCPECERLYSRRTGRGRHPIPLGGSGGTCDLPEAKAAGKAP